jgi:hypothetical protein
MFGIEETMQSTNKLLRQGTYPPVEPMVDIDYVWNDEKTGKYCEEIRELWDDPEDFADLGGHEIILPFGRIWEKGEDHLKKILKLADTKKNRKKTGALNSFDALWDKLKTAVSDDNVFFDL